MALIYGQDERLLNWASSRVGGIQFRPDATAIGWEREGEIRAVVVFDSFSAADCNMHIASDGTKRWMSKELLFAAFAYPFVQCGLRRVTGLVPAKNHAALSFDLHIGFKLEGQCRNALPDDDIIILGMTRGSCRFIAPEYRHD